MVFSSTVAGMAGMLTFVSNLPDALKTLRLHSLSKGISTLTVAIPFLIAVSSAFLGGLLALSEGWSYWEGFRFVFGAACGLGTPLTNVNPVTFRGRLISGILPCFDFSSSLFPFVFLIPFLSLSLLIILKNSRYLLFF